LKKFIKEAELRCDCEAADPSTSANQIESDLSLQESSRESESIHKHVEQEQNKDLQQEEVDKVEEDGMYEDLEKVELKDVEEAKNSYDELLTEWVTLTQPRPTNQKEDAKEIFCEDRERNRLDEEANQSQENRENSEQRPDEVVHYEKRKRCVKKVCWLCTAAKTDEGFDLHWCAGCRKARYCGLSCHEEDWERHKEFCQRVRKERRRKSRRMCNGDRRSV